MDQKTNTGLGKGMWGAYYMRMRKGFVDSAKLVSLALGSLQEAAATASAAASQPRSVLSIQITP